MISPLMTLALRSTHKVHHHAVAVVRNGRVLGLAYNSSLEHAEIRGLKRIKNKKGCLLWSIRLSKTGKLLLAKPCEDCESQLREWGIKAVYYSDSFGNILAERY
jgi:deoxycytidylate deaminase